MRKSRATFLASILGTILEFYDYMLYGVFTVIISQVFFPKGDPSNSLIMTLLVFSIGLFFRPLGGAVFGFIGDIKGRKKALFYSMILMGVSTFTIGILPSYSSSGYFSLVALIVCRLIQGLCAGGEQNGAAIFIIEHSKIRSKGIKGALVFSSAVLGNILALIAGTIVLREGMPFWAWRLPFLFSIFLSIGAIYFRYKIEETPEFLEKKKPKSKLSIFEFLKTYKVPIFRSLGVGGCYGTLVYMLTVYMNIHFSSFLQESPSSSTFIVAISLLSVIFLTPLFGYISDIVGHKRIMILGCIFTMIFSYPIFELSNYSIAFKLSSLLILAFSLSVFCGPMHAFLNSLFPPVYRYRGVATFFSVGTGFFGGMTPLFSTYLIKETQIIYAPCFILFLGGFIGYLSVNYRSTLKI